MPNLAFATTIQNLFAKFKALWGAETPLAQGATDVRAPEIGALGEDVLRWGRPSRFDVALRS